MRPFLLTLLLSAGCSSFASAQINWQLSPTALTSAAFTVTTVDPLSGSGVLTLQNLTGQICIRQPVQDLSLPVPVEAGQLPEGVYIVVLAVKEAVRCVKVVVRRE